MEPKSISFGGLFIFFLFTAAITSLVYATGEHDTAGDAEQGQIVNAYCPVMTDMQTTPDIFTDYKGKRVYFCCYNCKSTFGKEPEKYIDNLPQFGGTSVRTNDDHKHKIELARLIKPMGIITLSLLVLTVLVGLLRRKKPKLLLKWHKRLDIITLISAFIHTILVLIVY